MTNSSTWEETSKSQGHRRRDVEVQCSGVPLGVFGTIEMPVGSRRSTLGSEIEKIEEISINGRDKAYIIANWVKS